MSRLTYEISDENKKRLNILRAFATLNGEDPTLQEILNDAILKFYIEAYKTYCDQHPNNDFMKSTLEKLLPSFIDGEPPSL